MKTTTIPFFTDDISIYPHSAGGALLSCEQYLSGRPVTVREFARGLPVSLRQITPGNDLLIERCDGAFIQGPERI